MISSNNFNANIHVYKVVYLYLSLNVYNIDVVRPEEIQMQKMTKRPMKNKTPLRYTSK